VANVVFFKVTVYFLVEHWRNASTLTKSGENKGNFLIVVKLFFIMGESSDYFFGVLARNLNCQSF
jgi:hypothetical protein